VPDSMRDIADCLVPTFSASFAYDMFCAMRLSSMEWINKWPNLEMIH